MAKEVVRRCIDCRVQRWIARVIGGQHEHQQKAPEQEREAKPLEDTAPQRRQTVPNGLLAMAVSIPPISRRFGHASPWPWLTRSRFHPLQQPGYPAQTR